MIKRISEKMISDLVDQYDDISSIINDLNRMYVEIYRQTLTDQSMSKFVRCDCEYPIDDRDNKEAAVL